MFKTKVYVNRRKELKKKIGSGILFFPGHTESPMNYTGNQYPFRQDSSFLYYFGIDAPGLAAIIDIDEDHEIVFGDDRVIDDIIWMGEETPLSERAAQAGVRFTLPSDALQKILLQAVEANRTIHYLPQYRAESRLFLESLLGINNVYVNNYASLAMRKAVIAQRLVKDDKEIAEMEKASAVSYEMYAQALALIGPGMTERMIAGAMSGAALSLGEGHSFPTICSVRGETLHNHHYDNIMQNGDLLLIDSGAETSMRYASDITRTFPVSGVFTDRQRAVYQTVLNAQLAAIQKIKPGVLFKDVHLHAAAVIAGGLKELGIMKGAVSDIVDAGAHALFFPHGLGHAIGLDVHDLEALGENYVGYSGKLVRSTQFGLAYLRYAKKLEPGNALTVEPGIYFIKPLIEQWMQEKLHSDFINYDEALKFVGFGGIRIEDDVVVEQKKGRVLGRPIPKTIDEIEAILKR